jgi:hypothetical protein
MPFHQTVKLAFAAFATALLTACGGGGGAGGEADAGFTLEGGVAQKGALLKGSHVWINELNPANFASAGVTYDLLTKDNQGRFDLAGVTFARKNIQTFVQGYYFNEVTGQTADDMVLLQAQNDATTDKTLNVNLLTTLASPRIVALVNNKALTSTYKNFPAARAQAQKEVLAAFHIYNSADFFTADGAPANFGEMDLAVAQPANQLLAALSAVAVQAGGNGVGISMFIANLQSDLASNGAIVNPSLRSQIDTAAASVNMAAVATNLNSFYGINSYSAAVLSPWVDSSFGSDQVIDKYRFTVNCPVSGAGAPGTAPCPGTATEVKTTATPYVAGSDDAGQCISVSNGANLYRNGSPTRVTGSVLAVKGDSFVVGVMQSKATEARAYIQRSTAVSSACPTTTPVSNVVRVAKVMTSALQLVTDLASFADAAYASSNTALWGTNNTSPTISELALTAPGGTTKLFDDCFLNDGHTKAVALYNL